MVNDVVSIHVGAGSLREHPGVVQLNSLILIVSGIGSTLHHEVTVCHHNGAQVAVFKKRVFVDEDWVHHIGPVDLIDRVLIGQGDDQLVLQIIRVHSKLHEPIFVVSGSDQDILIPQHIQPVEPIQIVQEEDVSQVYLDVRDRQSFGMDVRAIHHSQQLQVRRVSG